LYLYCLGGKDAYHPTGVGVEWKLEENKNTFVRSYMTPRFVSHSEIEWLLWMAKVYKAEGDMEHYYNRGQMIIPGRSLRYDGVIYGETKNYCFNFNG
jgi:hypothetical protein